MAVQPEVSTAAVSTIKNVACLFLAFILCTVEQFYSTDFKSALRGGVGFSEWLKNSGNAEAGQRRNGLRVWGIGRGRAGSQCARDRLYIGYRAPRNADLGKGNSCESFFA